MAHEAADTDLVGTTLAGKYRVLGVIGSGGMGSVYEVEHTVTRRIGAFKLLHPAYAARDDVVTRFIREASAAARIRDPHIVESFDAGTLPSGAPYIFMELLHGCSLGELIEKRRRLPLALAQNLVAQAAAGLESAHRRGIVHRDVKPENLFVCEGPIPFVKILDFGICRLLGEESGLSRLTQGGVPLGTPHYMSREQVSGSEVTFRTDIHALGVVLYECLTGEVPFHADTLPALAVKIFGGDYPRATELVPELPTAVDVLLSTAMGHEPSRGFASMAEFRNALEALEAPMAFGATQVTGRDEALPSSVEVRTEPNPRGERGAPQKLDRASPSRLMLAMLLFGVGLAGVAAVRALSSSSRGDAVPDAPGPPSASTLVEDTRPSLPSSPASASSPPPSTALPPASVPSEAPRPPVSNARLGPSPALRSPSSPPRGTSRAERDGLARENPF